MKKTHEQIATEAIGFPPANGKKVTAVEAAAETPSALHISRFRTFHGLACRSVLEMKLAKYFAGLEVNALCDLHHDQHGETRGQFSTESKTDRLSVLPLEDYLEQVLGVTARTARRYRAYFLSVAQEAPQIALALNDKWQAMASNAMLLPATPVGLQQRAELDAEALQALCKHADEWGLHELFQTPEREVTPDPDKAAAAKAKKEALLKFWTESLVKRLDQEELHRLPPAALEAVVNKMEEAARKAREILKTKLGGRR